MLFFCYLETSKMILISFKTNSFLGTPLKAIKHSYFVNLVEILDIFLFLDINQL